MKNVPSVKIGIVAVSRNCFPEELAVSRRKQVVEEYIKLYGETDVYECPICIVESELHMSRALKNIEKEGCNALCIYLGNFGPEISESMLAKYFDGPVMVCAASETDEEGLSNMSRGDAYCGLLNASYNLNMRKTRVYIPPIPVGTPVECARMINRFVSIARAIIGIKDLKIISFGPRPSNFVACNAPIQPLYDLGVEIEENSELDLFEAYNKHADDNRIEKVIAEMKTELGEGRYIESILPKLAQYELTILDWVRTHKGCKKYVALTSKCWPAFQTQFGFVPCYVNSRLSAKGIPVGCEVDIYGCLSEYIGECLSNDIVTLLDINNTVPRGMFNEKIKDKEFLNGSYSFGDLFMGFHCGNTHASKVTEPCMGCQKIMSRFLPEELTMGTIEGDIIPGDVTMYRLQSKSNGELRAYIAQGEVLPVATESFGSIGIIAIKDMARFYRYVLIENNYPHHGAFVFGKYGRELFEVFKYLGIPYERIECNEKKDSHYCGENPYVSEEEYDGNII